MKRRVTEEMKDNVSFCEKWCEVEFTGDIENIEHVAHFLNEYLFEADNRYSECSDLIGLSLEDLC